MERYSWLRLGSLWIASSAWWEGVSQTGDNPDINNLESIVESYLFHNRQNPGFCVVVTVSSNTQINLLVRGILAVSLHKTEQRVLGGGGHSSRGEDGGVGGTHDVSGDGGETVAR